MAAENEFPKSNGDILYASEVNNFHSAGGLLQAGSFATIGSNASTQSIGSVVIGPGSLTNPCQLNMFLNITKNSNSTIFVEVSGTTNTSLECGSNGANVSMNVSTIIGSPMVGGLFGVIYGNGTNQTSVFYSKGNLSHLHPGSGVVVKFSGRVTDDLTVNGYNIQSFRGV